MAWDIYGNNLRRGYCEVHPYVPEEYPCYICMQEIDRENERHYEQQRQDDLVRQYNEQQECEAMEEEELKIIADHLTMINRMINSID